MVDAEKKAARQREAAGAALDYLLARFAVSSGRTREMLTLEAVGFMTGVATVSPPLGAELFERWEADTGAVRDSERCRTA